MSDTSHTLLQRAADWLQQGQSLQSEGRIDEALSLFDQTIAAVRSVPTSDHEVRRVLGVAWMNRGNTLQQLGTAVSLADAVSAYNEAIAVLETLPIDAQPIYRNHLGAAWLNRGHALLVASDAAGIASFEQAIVHLEKLPLATDPYFLLNLVGARTNLANALLSIEPPRALGAARTALGELAPVEHEHEAFAAMSLRARRALVLAMGAQLPGGTGVPPMGLEKDGQDAHATPTTLLAEATDAIDDGLVLAGEFEARGSTELRPLAVRLYRLGAQLYGGHQPQFLGEYLLEHLATPGFAADAEFRAVAEQALAQALQTIRTPQFLIAGDPDTTRVLALSQTLRAAQRDLAALRSRSTPILPVSPP